MARKVGVPVSTVKSWHRKGRIPRWRHGDIVHAAQVWRVDVSWGDLQRVAIADAKPAKAA